MNTATSVRQARSPAGFSVVELLVVTGLIAIMVAFSLPSIGRYIRNYRIRGGANEVAGALQQARLRAITGNVNYGVLFITLNNTSFRVVREDGVEQPGDKQRITGDRRSVLSLVSPPLESQQAGPIQQLPQDIVFADAAAGCPELAAAVPPYVASTALAVRFDRLGAICKPAGTAEPCPQPDTGQAFLWERNNNDLAVCVRELRTGLTRTVMISPAGRVQVVENTAELNQ